MGVSPAIHGPPHAVPAGHAAPLHLQTDDSLSRDDGEEVDLSVRAALPPRESQGVKHRPLCRVWILPQMPEDALLRTRGVAVTIRRNHLRHLQHPWQREASGDVMRRQQTPPDGMSLGMRQPSSWSTKRRFWTVSAGTRPPGTPARSERRHFRRVSPTTAPRHSALATGVALIRYAPQSDTPANSGSSVRPSARARSARSCRRCPRSPPAETPEPTATRHPPARRRARTPRRGPAS